MNWRSRTICDGLTRQFPADLAHIVAEYAEHTELEKLTYVLEEASKLGINHFVIKTDKTIVKSDLKMEWFTSSFSGNLQVKFACNASLLHTNSGPRLLRDALPSCMDMGFDHVSIFISDAERNRNIKANPHIKSVYTAFMAEQFARY